MLTYLCLDIYKREKLLQKCMCPIRTIFLYESVHDSKDHFIYRYTWMYSKAGKGDTREILVNVKGYRYINP